MPTSSDDAPFLSAILAHPQDDGPRLIYADFLEESDSEADRARAELIRVQCAIARLPDDHPRREELIGTEAELMHRYQEEWAEPFRGLTLGMVFRRGIVDSVVVDPEVFLTRGAELFQQAPIRRVRFHDASRSFPALALSPLLEKVRELDFSGNDLGNGGVNLLLRSPHLQGIERLDLSFNSLGDGAMQLLARHSGFIRLSELGLSGNGQISSEGVRGMAESAHLPALRSLDLSGNDLCDAGVRALAESRRFPRLHTLILYANHIGDAGVAALTGSPLIERMLAHESRLDLRQNAITAVGAQTLASSPRVAKVTQLELSGNYLEDAGVSAIAQSDHLPRLRTLRLKQNQIGDNGALALARSPLMNQLSLIDLSGNRLTRKGSDTLWLHRRDFRTEIILSENLMPLLPDSLEASNVSPATSITTILRRS